MKTITLEFTSKVTYSLVVNAESEEEAIDKFLNDEYDLNYAIESDSDTDFDNVKVTSVIEESY